MLEQAIVDAAALREAALKNAEQTLIEKYAPQIKEAVEAMLEETPRTMKYEGRVVEIIHPAEGGKVTVAQAGGKPFVVNEADLQDASADDLLKEEEMDMAMGGPGGEESNLTSIEAPLAGNPNVDPNEPVTLSLEVDEIEGDIKIDLAELEQLMEMDPEEPNPDDLISIGGDVAPEVEAEDDLLGGGLGDLDLGDLGGEEEEEPLEEPLTELLSLLEEYEMEESIKYDGGAADAGWITTDKGHQMQEQDMEEAAENLNEEEEDSKEEDSEDEDKATSELYETIELLKSQNSELETVVYKLSDKLEETLLSNAKLLYQNRTLCDASLNERQKAKIVEAIAKAESPKEAKHLHETLRTTVGSKHKKGPQSLSESVNRRSNLSGMLNRGQNLNETQD